MKFKIDENLPTDVAEMLRQVGYDAMTVYDQQIVGEKDDNIAAICQLEQRAIVTLDTDFADIRAYPPSNYSGIIVMRLKQQDKPYVLSIVGRWIKALPEDTLQGQLWIVDRNKLESGSELSIGKGWIGGQSRRFGLRK